MAVADCQGAIFLLFSSPRLFVISGASHCDHHYQFEVNHTWVITIYYNQQSEETAYKVGENICKSYKGLISRIKNIYNRIIKRQIT